MAQIEGSVDEGKPTEDQLRKILLEQTLFGSVRFKVKIEQKADETYSVPIGVQFDGKEHGILEFRRWTHQQANRFQNLSYLSKFNEKEVKLTADEATHYLNFQREMVLDSLVNASRWKDLVESSDIFVGVVFTLIAKVSGVSTDFDDDLDKFMRSDYGFLYGYVWFQLLGRTPSDIGRLPETDVRVINAWLKNWSERVSQK